MREDYAANALHTVELGQGWRTKWVARCRQSRANAAHTGLWLARLSYEQALSRLLAQGYYERAYDQYFSGSLSCSPCRRLRAQ